MIRKTFINMPDLCIIYCEQAIPEFSHLKTDPRRIQITYPEKVNKAAKLAIILYSFPFVDKYIIVRIVYVVEIQHRMKPHRNH